MKYDRFEYQEGVNPMALDEPEEGRCNEEIDGGYCARYPAVNSEGEAIDDKCTFHGEGMDVMQGNDNGAKHYLYSWRSNYYYNMGRRDQIWTDMLIESFLEDADFDRQNLGKMEILRQVAIDIHKIRTANEYIWDEGLAQIKEVYDSEEGTTKEIEDENILNLPVDRLQRQCTKRLKELGVLDDPDSSLAESTATLAEVLAGVEDEVSEYEG